jgi:hypothetical protein
MSDTNGNASVFLRAPASLHKENKEMALSIAELEHESGAVLPARDTMFIINFGFARTTAHVNANSAALSIVNRAGGATVLQNVGSEVSVNQLVIQ